MRAPFRAPHRFRRGRGAPAPAPTAERLPLYLHELRRLSAEGTPGVTSADLAARLGLRAAQVRRDLAHFGELGIRGTGYRVAALLSALEKVVGVRKPRRVVVIGSSPLACALAEAAAPLGPSAKLVGRIAFSEEDPAKDDAALAALAPELAILADGPASPALAERLRAGGVRALLELCSAALPRETLLPSRRIDLASELERLAYEADELSRRGASPSAR